MTKNAERAITVVGLGTLVVLAAWLGLPGWIPAALAVLMFLSAM